MRHIARAVFLAVALAAVGLPAGAQTLGTIAGVVKDPSAAVLPGVTVEAASPALIERVRTAATDGTGLYRIVNLPPGLYTVTFTLPGFNQVRREGVQVAAVLDPVPHQQRCRHEHHHANQDPGGHKQRP